MRKLRPQAVKPLAQGHRAKKGKSLRQSCGRGAILLLQLDSTPPRPSAARGAWGGRRPLCRLHLHPSSLVARTRARPSLSGPNLFICEEVDETPESRVTLSTHNPRPWVGKLVPLLQGWETQGGMGQGVHLGFRDKRGARPCLSSPSTLQIPQAARREAKAAVGSSPDTKADY